LNIHHLTRYAITRLFLAPRFQAFGSRSTLYHATMIANPSYMRIGSHSTIRDGARLEVVLRPHVSVPPCLSIGDNVNIEQGAHIICQGRVTIEDEVSITPYCVIVDVEHPFDAPDRPPKMGSRLNARTDSFVRIGRGSFIGAHSVILPNVSIGLGCVIGAGSVVTKSIPDYCVAAGSPARVIRRFDTQTRKWDA